MKYRGVCTLGVLQAFELACTKIELDTPDERRVGIGLEVGVDQVGEVPRVAVDLDQVCPFDDSQIGTGAAFVNPEERVQRIEGTSMDVDSVRQQFADLRI